MRENKREVLTQFHRTNIIQAAEKLFLEKGIEHTTMDNIAKEADYSKATLYVYFKNKEEIIGSITLISMKLFYEFIQKALSGTNDCTEQYHAFCYTLLNFQKSHPFYYECLLKEINVDLELPETPMVFHEIYNVGEEINHSIGILFEKGIAQGLIHSDINVSLTVLIIWAQLNGVISLALQKEKYLTKCLGITQEEFYKYSFDSIYKSIFK